MTRHLPPPPPLGDDSALFLDFDGTLVEFAETPDAIIVPDGLVALLSALTARLDGGLAVVSGRPIAQIDRFLGGAITAVAGLHGFERRDATGTVTAIAPPRAALDAARAALAPFGDRHDGVLVEDKGASLALHYRRRPDLEDACDQLAREIADGSTGVLHVQPGHAVRELKPRAASKGKAVTAYLDEAPFRGRVPVYVGDDMTDEDGFAAAAAHHGLGILAGAPRPTAARHRLDSVAAVRAWLED